MFGLFKKKKVERVNPTRTYRPYYGATPRQIAPYDYSAPMPIVDNTMDVLTGIMIAETLMNNDTTDYSGNGGDFGGGGSSSDYSSCDSSSSYDSGSSCDSSSSFDSGSY